MTAPKIAILSTTSWKLPRPGEANWFTISEKKTMETGAETPTNMLKSIPMKNKVISKPEAYLRSW